MVMGRDHADVLLGPVLHLPVHLDGPGLQLLEALEPLRHWETLLGRPCPHLRPYFGFGVESRNNGLLELAEQVSCAARLDGVPPSWHLA
jgi:hypothetical protein